MSLRFIPQCTDYEGCYMVLKYKINIKISSQLRFSNHEDQWKYKFKGKTLR